MVVFFCRNVHKDNGSLNFIRFFFLAYFELYVLKVTVVLYVVFFFDDVKGYKQAIGKKL